MLDNLDNDNSEAYLKATKEYTQNPGGFTKGELNCQATRRPFIRKTVTLMYVSVCAGSVCMRVCAQPKIGLLGVCVCVCMSV